MRALKKITFLIEEFALGTPAQQLLDRFLIGYPRDGEFRRFEGCQIVACSPLGTGSEDLNRRVQDFGLVIESDLGRAVTGADAVVVVPRGAGELANEALINFAIENVLAPGVCFVHGVLANNGERAGAFAARAVARGLPLFVGTWPQVAWRLPNVEVPAGSQLTEALIVVQGPNLVAEFHALEILLALAAARLGGENGSPQLSRMAGVQVWDEGKKGTWSWPLLAVALSRSNSPQGDSIKDGRTQDLVRLGLVEKLAREPRGWTLQHRDGLRSTILVLDGVVADSNFALQMRDGSVISAQIYRPPPPSDHQFSRLAAVMEDFFRSAKPTWPVRRNVTSARLLAAMKELSAPVSPG